MNHMLHGAVARIGGAIKRIEGADGAKYSFHILTILYEFCKLSFHKRQIISNLRKITFTNHDFFGGGS